MKNNEKPPHQGAHHIMASTHENILTAVRPHPDTFIEDNGDTDSIVFWCDAMPRAHVAGCIASRSFGAYWDFPYHRQPPTTFDHMPDVLELECAFRDLRRRAGVDPLTGMWLRKQS